MSNTAHPIAAPLPQPSLFAGASRLGEPLRAWGQPVLFGLRLWASVSLALYAAYWLQLDSPFWAGTSAAIVCQPQLGASLRKGWFRMLGTIAGAVMSIVLIACFPQDRAAFLISLALWAAACAFVATVLRNFASYAAALAGYTAAIIGADLLGTVGGIDANAAFLLAVARATAICLGIACAGIVLAATDLGDARRRLAALFAELAGRIAVGLSRTLAQPGQEGHDARAVQRELLGRAIELDPIVDQALGESSQVRYHSPVLRRAVDGLFSALAVWYELTNHLARLPRDQAQAEAATVLGRLPEELRSAPASAVARWVVAPAIPERSCRTAAAQLSALPTGTPSLRLLADKAADAVAGIGDALNGVALLGGDPVRPVGRCGGVRVPDYLPALVSAGRAFVTVIAVALFWIVTGWPGGAQAITFAAIVCLLLAPRGDEAYGAALIVAVSAVLALILTAIVNFAVLPGLRTDGFGAFSLALGAVFVPCGALLKRARVLWQVGLLSALTALLLPILQPTNPPTYDTLVFYNVGLTIVAGVGAAALSFRLIPPLSPAFRTRRLLALTLRDLRRLARRRDQGDWQAHVVARLSVLPQSATSRERADLVAALVAGSELAKLRQHAERLGFSAALETALAPIAQGDSASATTRLAGLDAALALHGEASTEISAARGSIRALSETLTQHAAYFDTGEPT